MATSLISGPAKVQPQSSLNNGRTAPSGVTDGSNFSYSGPTLTNGVAAGNANYVYKVQLTLAASASTTVDLSNVTDVFGNAMNFVRIKELYVENNVATASASIQVGAAGIANPVTIATLSQTASGGGLSDGTYKVAYSWTNGTGETLISPIASIVVNGGGSSQLIGVTNPAMPAGVTGINYYLSLVAGSLALAKDTTGTTTTKNLTALPSTGNQAILTANTTLNGIQNVFGTQADSLIIRNGMVGYLGECGDATGYALTSSNKNLLVVNLDNSKSATVNLTVTGCSA